MQLVLTWVSFSGRDFDRVWGRVCLGFNKVGFEYDFTYIQFGLGLNWATTGQNTDLLRIIMSGLQEADTDYIWRDPSYFLIMDGWYHKADLSQNIANICPALGFFQPK